MHFWRRWRLLCADWFRARDWESWGFDAAFVGVVLVALILRNRGWL